MDPDRPAQVVANMLGKAIRHEDVRMLITRKRWGRQSRPIPLTISVRGPAPRLVAIIYGVWKTERDDDDR
jgi:hypothetical protein